VDDIATAEWGADWGGLYAGLAERFSECFLLPGGTDSRRVLATGEPDEWDEYPVFALDIDDLPYIGVMYPGFDVHLADTFGVIEREPDGYTSLASDPIYGERMRQHAQNWFAGRTSAEYPLAHVMTIPCGRYGYGQEVPVQGYVLVTTLNPGTWPTAQETQEAHGPTIGVHQLMDMRQRYRSPPGPTGTAVPGW
jgi:hypothetical protein